jgi:hypothetical protein
VLTTAIGCSKRSPFLHIFKVFDITSLMYLSFLGFYELSGVLVVLWLYGFSLLFAAARS